MVIGILAGLVLMVGVVALQLLQARRDRARTDAVAKVLLTDAAAVLGLGAPQLVASTHVRWACAGKMRDLDAELGASGRWGRVSVSVEVEGLPPEVSVVPRPTGRGTEDYYLGVAVNSGNGRFDDLYCLYGSKECSGEALTEAAKTVRTAVLDFAVAHFDPAYEVTLAPNALVVRPVWEPMRQPADDLVALWRFAEKLVSDGLERAVLRR